MQELVISLHMHTVYSDGTGTHQDLAEAAMRAGLDAIIVTDHNILVQGPEKYYQKDGKRVLLLVGEEIHDRYRLPQKNHLLCLGANRELTTFAGDPQKLIDQVIQAEGLAFLAHPFEDALEMIGETDISWEDWHVKGYTGIELWNGLSELKSVIHSPLQALFYVLFPQYYPHGPLERTLRKWDDLTADSRVVAVGGADAHALRVRRGPLTLRVFPYEYHFRAITTHLLVPQPLSGDLAADRRMIYTALAQGHAYIGYDQPAATRGFRFSAEGESTSAIMGDEITLKDGITLKIRLPGRAHCRLIKDGQVIKSFENRDNYTHITSQPGVYRVEAYVPYLGKKRGWIFSNPIYVREA